MKVKLLFFFLLAAIKIQAQQAASTSGGTISGATGSASYSVGQVSYTAISGSNGSSNAGVQQAYIITEVTIGVNDKSLADINIVVYPNPVSELLKLKTNEKHVNNLSFELVDSNGKTILNQNINEIETTIALDELPAATYILKVTTKEKYTLIKTFKIIKTN